jgi:hypothetical protein
MRESGSAKRAMREGQSFRLASVRAPAEAPPSFERVESALLVETV